MVLNLQLENSLAMFTAHGLFTMGRWIHSPGKGLLGLFIF